MLYKDDEFVNDGDDRSEQKQSNPNAYRVEDDNTIDEDDLKRSLLFEDREKNPVMEGKPMGGQNFGQNNVTPAGDDKNNPSQNAGYTNEYFRRTEPAEEHPEDNNFKPQDQQGGAGNAINTAGGNNPDKPGATPQPKQSYQEGTADNDGKGNAQPNIPGPNEVPDQQKVGENDDDNNYHLET